MPDITSTGRTQRYILGLVLFQSLAFRNRLAPPMLHNNKG